MFVIRHSHGWTKIMFHHHSGIFGNQITFDLIDNLWLCGEWVSKMGSSGIAIILSQLKDKEMKKKLYRWGEGIVEQLLARIRKVMGFQLLLTFKIRNEVLKRDWSHWINEGIDGLLSAIKILKKLRSGYWRFENNRKLEKWELFATCR